MHRIFIAINLPEKVKTELEKLEKEIESLFPPKLNRGMFRWVKKENLHITLLFIGAVRDEEIPKISQIVKDIAQSQKPFSLRIEKVSYGPPKKIPPRLIWVEVGRKPELSEIAKKLKKEMAESGILRKVEQREFSPHITLARIKSFWWKRIEPEERPEIEREIALDFEVNSIEIMESKLKKTGAEYTTLESAKLG
ncbi:MAG: RNA 2',3'-cyclic phosphodiesterase [Candidatus Nealsonbacteria bacterium]|nr:MAG: RNA 2',3'-cyclic phosphodiesterase [Candidatus Nealsonbacteria bacterium]